MLLLIIFAFKSLHLVLIITCFFVHCFIVTTVSIDLGRVLPQWKEGFPFIACLGVPQSLKVLNLALLVVVHLVIHKVLFDGACPGHLISISYVRRRCAQVVIVMTVPRVSSSRLDREWPSGSSREWYCSCSCDHKRRRVVHVWVEVRYVSRRHLFCFITIVH